MEVLTSPGKINLLLRVTGKLENGYHKLLTWFHPVYDICDTVAAEWESSSGISMSCDRPDVPVDSSNLIWKAAESFAAARGITPCWHFDLHKSIPVAAGMGGGSSNAGSVLRALDRKYPGLERQELFDIARRLGADVPFFLDPADAVARGIGDDLKSMDILPDIPMLVAAFDFPVLASWSYAHLQRMTAEAEAEAQAEELTKALFRQDWPQAAGLMGNDLEIALFDKFPLLNVLKKELISDGALGVHISGSGPSMFAIFEGFSKRDSAAARLRSISYLSGNVRIMECK